MFLIPNMAMYPNLSHWSFLNLKDIGKKCITIDQHFWTSVGPTILIRIVDPLCNTKNGYGFKFQPMIPCTSREIGKKLRFVGYAQVKTSAFHVIFQQSFFPFILSFKIFSHKLMIQTIGNVLLPKHGLHIQIWAIDLSRISRYLQKMHYHKYAFLNLCGPHNHDLNCWSSL